MKKINILISLSFIALSGYLYMGNAPKITVLLFLLIGIASVALDLVFSSNEPFDERQKEIKMKSGHISYLISIVYLFFMLLSLQYEIVTNPIMAIFIVLAGHILTFPLVSLFYSRRM